MKIPFVDICKTGNQYDITSDGWFPVSDMRRCRPVLSTVVLCRKGEGQVEVSGFLQTGVSVDCDRCLTQFDIIVDSRFHLVLEVAGKQSQQIKELEISACEEFDIVELKDPVVDLEDILRQQLYLSLPDKFLCSRECKGLCVTCGAELNTTNCHCKIEEKSSPFSVLTSLKKR